MAIVWGSVVNDYGRIGINKIVTTTDDSYTLTVELWFWSKYSVSDTNNALYYNNLASSGSATTSLGATSVQTTVASGTGWSESNKVRIKTIASVTYPREKTTTYRYLYAKLSNIDRVGGIMYVSTTLKIDPINQYRITYNANGGNGAPATQIKYHGENVKISTTRPTREGYIFQGWSTSATGSGQYVPGETYSTNSNLTLYAIWKVKTYTYTYNLNGGTGSIANQTKTHGVPLNITSAKPTRTNYEFCGWNVILDQSSTLGAYQPGYTCQIDADTTFYAVWKLSYIKPTIYNLSVSRCDKNGNVTSDGTYALVKFDFKTTYDVKRIIVSFTRGGSSEWELGNMFDYSTLENFTEGTLSLICGNGQLVVDRTYTVEVEVHDSQDYFISSTTLSGMAFPVDAKAGGDGVSFGKEAALGKEHSLGGTGVAEFAFDGKFNAPVYGKVTGLDKLPYIPSGNNLNDYLTTGCWAIYSNSSESLPSRADQIYCGDKLLGTDDTVPPARAGRFEVISATGEGIRAEEYSYLRQKFYPYNSSNAVWERDITRGSDNNWTFYDWWQSSLTPVASGKVYDKAAITVALSANVTLGVVNTYTKIPFNTTSLKTSDRLSLSSNAVRIGKNIQHVKVSGQTLVKTGVAGQRHVRIQKVSGGTTTSLSWDCIHAVANANTLYPFTPVIVSVKEGDLIQMVYYTSDTTDANVSGSSANGWQSYLTVEEL